MVVSLTRASSPQALARPDDNLFLAHEDEITFSTADQGYAQGQVLAIGFRPGRFTSSDGGFVSHPDMLSVKRGLVRRLTRSLLGGAALAALATLSAGCSTTATSDVNPAAYDHRLRHPIMISEEPENFDMRVGMNGPALSREIETAVRQYVSEYRSDGTGSITIQVPTGSANEIAVASTGHAVHYALVRAGVPRGNIQVAPYEVGDHSVRLAPLRLRVKAVTPTADCPRRPNQVDHAQY